MEPPSFLRCSILLIIKKLMNERAAGSDFNTVVQYRQKGPGAETWEVPGVFHCEPITSGWHALFI